MSKRRTNSSRSASVRLWSCLVLTMALSIAPERARAERLFLPPLSAGARSAAGAVQVDVAAARDLAAQPRVRKIDDVPLADGTHASFRVEPLDVFAPGATIVEFDGKTNRPIGRPNVRVYTGEDAANPNRSLVLAIASGNQVVAVVREGGESSTVIQPVAGSATGEHRVVDPASRALPDPSKACGVSRSDQADDAHREAAAAYAQRLGTDFARTLAIPPPTLAAQVFVDVGYDLYTQVFGSNSTTATEYVALVFGTVSGIYRRDANVAVLVSQLVIWAAPDPFAGVDARTQMDAYEAWTQVNRVGVPRTTSHLLAHLAGAGGFAHVGVLCRDEFSVAASNLDGGYTASPTSGYLGDIHVVAHELGHNFGSEHTHCYVPAIDHCYSLEAGCYAGPVEPSVGEIMSYCGTRNLDFGDRVAQILRNGAERAACVANAGGVCGNGVVEDGEQCDDGNLTDGDCCSSRCFYDSPYSYCTSDGDPCTSDSCDGFGICTYVAPGLCSACATPTVVPPDGGVFVGTTSGSSTISGSCGGAGPEHVFSWTPNNTGPVTISTCGSSFDTVVYVRKDTCDIGEPLGCNDDACGAQSQLNLVAEAGATYFIVVDSAAAGGSFSLTVPEPPCGNGVLDSYEECDDGNTVDGDGCGPTCLRTPIGFDLTSLGTPTARVMAPIGGGNHDIEVIRDGDRPFPGNGDSFRQYDTFNGPNTAPDWIGYTLPSLQTFSEILFQEGKHFFDGGWFTTLTVEVRRNGVWVPVTGLVTTPTYPGIDDGLSFETYLLAFTPITGDGVRIYGAPGGSIGFVSVGELRAYGAAPGVGVCGNGTVEGPEECDLGAGNGVAGSCCSSSCLHFLDGTTCDDGQPSTCGDQCQTGVCIGATPTCGDGILAACGAEECDDGNLVSGDGCSATCQTDPVTACAINPRSGCRLPVASAKASLKIKDATSDAKDQLQWKWGSGAATSVLDFGAPTTTESYFLCLYDNGTLISSTSIPAGGLCAGKPCWKGGSTGFQYSSKSLLPDGAKQLKLKAGGYGKAQIQLKAAGVDLETPALGSLTGPIVVQLRQTSDTACWEAVYSAPFGKNDGVSFSDKAD